MTAAPFTETAPSGVVWLDAAEAALDLPDDITDEPVALSRDVVATLDRISERLKRRELELWVKIALDEYRGPIPIRRPKEAS